MLRTYLLYAFERFLHLIVLLILVSTKTGFVRISILLLILAGFLVLNERSRIGTAGQSHAKSAWSSSVQLIAGIGNSFLPILTVAF